MNVFCNAMILAMDDEITYQLYLTKRAQEFAMLPSIHPQFCLGRQEVTNVYPDHHHQYKISKFLRMTETI